MHLVFDGVTLTKAPRKLSGRQKHAAQSIKAMWVKKGEAMDPDTHTHTTGTFYCCRNIFVNASDGTASGVRLSC